MYNKCFMLLFPLIRFWLVAITLQLNHHLYALGDARCHHSNSHSRCITRFDTGKQSGVIKQFPSVIISSSLWSVDLFIYYEFFTVQSKKARYSFNTHWHNMRISQSHTHTNTFKRMVSCGVFQPTIHYSIRVFLMFTRTHTQKHTRMAINSHTLMRVL